MGERRKGEERGERGEGRGERGERKKEDEMERIDSFLFTLVELNAVAYG